MSGAIFLPVHLSAKADHLLPPVAIRSPPFSWPAKTGAPSFVGPQNRSPHCGGPVPSRRPDAHRHGRPARHHVHEM